MDYTQSMLEIVKSDTYEQWFRKLKDRQAQVRINARILRVQQSGHFGDVKQARDAVNSKRNAD
jgi:putative addiction module killer protein